MRFRMGMMMGFGAGYYLGAKAGRARYEQLNAMVRRLKRSDAYEAATTKATEVAHVGVEKARDFVEEHRPGHEGHDAGNGDAAWSTSKS